MKVSLVFCLFFVCFCFWLLFLVYLVLHININRCLGNMPSHGSELCTVVETMYSFQLMQEILGDPVCSPPSLPPLSLFFSPVSYHLSTKL